MDTRALIVFALVGCGDGTVPALSDSVLSPDARVLPTLPAGNVAFYTFDNTLGDASGNSYNASCGGPYIEVFGHAGYIANGFWLDGTQQYGLVGPYHPKLDFTGAFTVEAWVHVDQTPSDFAVIVSRSFGTGSESSFALVVDSSMRLRYDSQGGGSLTSTSPVPLATWTHVALTYDGSVKRVFINGTLEGAETAPAPVTWDHGYILFGADEQSSLTDVGHRMQGTLDEVMFFDRALDASELVSD